MRPAVAHQIGPRAARALRGRGGLAYGGALLLLVTVAGTHPVARSATAPRAVGQSNPIECRPDVAPCLRVANAHIRADVNPLGGFSLGTTGGDPGTPLDDDLGLLYGFVPGGASNTGSGFVTVRIDGPGGVDDFVVRVPDDVRSQVEVGGAVRTVWQRRSPHRVTITQTLSAAANPYSGRPDLLDMHWQVTNDDAVPLSIGLRALLDIQVGANDGAPYFVPGVGTLTFERQFSGDQVPPFWIAFQAADFDPSFLRGLGLVRDDDVTAPDDLVVANWRKIQEQPFTYAVDATRVITGDSAVALYWRPRPVPPGGSFEQNTRYGIAANQGGRSFLTVPVQSECGTTFPVALFVTNFDLAPLTGGVAAITLPAGLELVSGEAAAKPLGRIEPGDTRSVVWSVRVSPGASGPRRIEARAHFDGGRSFEATADMTTTCVGPTATPTTPTPTVPPPTPTPLGTEPGVCDWLYGRVPRVAIEAALADPTVVFGWNKPQNPNRPVSPVNPLRRWLSLANRGVPYHPVNNPLIFKAGCP